MSTEILYQKLGIRVLTPDFEILLNLLDQPFLSCQELQYTSSLSRAGFFKSLDRLKHWGFVSSAVSLSDRRKKEFFLTNYARGQIVANVKQLCLLVLDKNLFSLKRPPVGSYRPSDDPNLVDSPSYELPHITCEYQILIHLLIQPGAAGFQLAEYVTTSATTFAAAMRRLKARNLIYDQVSPDCGRRKRFFLCDSTRETIESARLLLSDYIADLERDNSGPRAATS